MSIQQLLEEENEGEGISMGANHVATQVGQGPLENKQGTPQEQKQHALISSTNKRYFKKKKGKLWLSDSEKREHPTSLKAPYGAW